MYYQSWDQGNKKAAKVELKGNSWRNTLQLIRLIGNRSWWCKWFKQSVFLRSKGGQRFTDLYITEAKGNGTISKHVCQSKITKTFKRFLNLLMILKPGSKAWISDGVWCIWVFIKVAAFPHGKTSVLWCI